MDELIYKKSFGEKALEFLRRVSANPEIPELGYLKGWEDGVVDFSNWLDGNIGGQCDEDE